MSKELIYQSVTLSAVIYSYTNIHIYKTTIFLEKRRWNIKLQTFIIWLLDYKDVNVSTLERTFSLVFLYSPKKGVSFLPFIVTYGILGILTRIDIFSELLSSKEGKIGVGVILGILLLLQYVFIYLTSKQLNK